MLLFGYLWQVIVTCNERRTPLFFSPIPRFYATIDHQWFYGDKVTKSWANIQIYLHFFQGRRVFSPNILHDALSLRPLHVMTKRALSVWNHHAMTQSRNHGRTYHITTRQRKSDISGERKYCYCPPHPTKAENEAIRIVKQNQWICWTIPLKTLNKSIG